MTSNQTRVHVGDIVLLDALSARCVRLHPTDEVGIVLDLEGELNGLQIRDAHRYAMSAGHAAELIVELISTANIAAQLDGEGRDFADRLNAALDAERVRRGL